MSVVAAWSPMLKRKCACSFEKTIKNLFRGKIPDAQIWGLRLNTEELGESLKQSGATTSHHGAVGVVHHGPQGEGFDL